jgi:hypothetical protein
MLFIVEINSTILIIVICFVTEKMVIIPIVTNNDY